MSEDLPIGIVRYMAPEVLLHDPGARGVCGRSIGLWKVLGLPPHVERVLGHKLRFLFGFALGDTISTRSKRAKNNAVDGMCCDNEPLNVWGESTGFRDYRPKTVDAITRLPTKDRGHKLRFMFAIGDEKSSTTQVWGCVPE